MAAFTVEIAVKSSLAREVRKRPIAAVIRAVLRAEGYPAPASVGLLVTDDAEIQSLNRTYLGHDYATDVIAFGTEGPATFIDPPVLAPHLGDVVVSYERAREQAAEADHSVDYELLFLVAHGVLHLLGHEDASPEARQAMLAAQERIITGVLHAEPGSSG